MSISALKQILKDEIDSLLIEVNALDHEEADEVMQLPKLADLKNHFKDVTKRIKYFGDSITRRHMALDMPQKQGATEPRVLHVRRLSEAEVANLPDHFGMLKSVFERAPSETLMQPEWAFLMALNHESAVCIIDLKSKTSSVCRAGDVHMFHSVRLAAIQHCETLIASDFESFQMQNLQLKAKILRKLFANEELSEAAQVAFTDKSFATPEGAYETDLVTRLFALDFNNQIAFNDTLNQWLSHHQ